eukprot:660454-Hanusia_phi.AAC.1
MIRRSGGDLNRWHQIDRVDFGNTHNGILLAILVAILLRFVFFQVLCTQSSCDPLSQPRRLPNKPMASNTMSDICFQYSLFMRHASSDSFWMELVDELDAIMAQENNARLSEWSQLNSERFVDQVIHPFILGYVRRPYVSALLECLKKSTQFSAKNVNDCPDHWNPFDWRLVTEFLTSTQLFVADDGSGRARWLRANDAFQFEIHSLGLSNVVGKNLETDTVMQTLRSSLVLAMILSENPIRCMQIYLEVKGKCVDVNANDEEMILKSIEVYFKQQQRVLRVIHTYLAYARSEQTELCHHIFWADGSLLKSSNCSCLMQALVEAAEICLHKSIEGNECIPERHLHELQLDILSELRELCKMMPLGAECHKISAEDLGVLESLTALYMKISCITFSEISAMDHDASLSIRQGVDEGKMLLMTDYRLHTSTCSCILADVLNMLICGIDADSSSDVHGAEGDSIFHGLVEFLHSSRFEEMNNQYISSGREGLYISETLKWSPDMIIQHLLFLSSIRLGRCNSAEAFNYAIASCSGCLHHLALLLDLPALSRWPDVKEDLTSHNAHVVSFAIDVLEHFVVNALDKDEKTNVFSSKKFDSDLAEWNLSVETSLACIACLAADPQVAFHVVGNDHLGRLLEMVQKALRLTESDPSEAELYNHRDHERLLPSLRLAGSFFKLFSTLFESFASLPSDDLSFPICFERLVTRLNQAIRLFRASPPTAFTSLQDYCRLSSAYMSFPTSHAVSVEQKKYFHSQLKRETLATSELHTSGNCFHPLFQSHFAVLAVEKKESLRAHLSLYESALIQFFSSLLDLIRTCCAHLTAERLWQLNLDHHVYSREMMVAHLDVLLSTWTEPVSPRIKKQALLLMQELVPHLRRNASELASFVRKVFRLLYAPVVDLDHAALEMMPADGARSQFNMFYMEFFVIDRSRRKYDHTIAFLQLVSSLLPSFPADVSRRFLADCYPIIQHATESQSAENFLDPKEKWRLVDELMRMGCLCLYPHLLRDDWNSRTSLTRTKLDGSVFASASKSFTTGASSEYNHDVRKLIHWMIHPELVDEDWTSASEVRGMADVAVELVGRGLELAERKEETIALAELSSTLQSCMEFLIVLFQLCSDQCEPQEVERLLDQVCWSWTGSNEKPSRRKIPLTVLEYAALEDEPELASLALELLLVIISSSKSPQTRDVVLAEVLMLDTELDAQARITDGLSGWFERAQASSDELHLAICSKILHLLLASLRTLEGREEESPSFALTLLGCQQGASNLFTTITRRLSLHWPRASELEEELVLTQANNLRRASKCSELAAMTSEMMFRLVRSPWAVKALSGSLEEEMSLLLEHMAADFPYFELIDSLRDRVAVLRSGQWLVEQGFEEAQARDFNHAMRTWEEEEAMAAWMSRYPKGEEALSVLT